MLFSIQNLIIILICTFCKNVLFQFKQKKNLSKSLKSMYDFFFLANLFFPLKYKISFFESKEFCQYWFLPLVWVKSNLSRILWVVSLSRKFFAFFRHLWSRPTIVFNGDLSFKFRFEMRVEKSSTIFPSSMRCSAPWAFKVDDVQVSSVLVDMRNDGEAIPRRKEVKSVEQARWPYLFNFGHLIILNFHFGPQKPKNLILAWKFKSCI